MTKDEARHVAAILTAWADGETIQWRHTPTEEAAKWIDTDLDANDWQNMFAFPNVYRIKPKPREWWAYVGPQNNIQGTFSRKPAPCTGIETIKIGEII